MASNDSIAKQINYYLSDENLAHDEFFYKEIAANKYIPNFILDSTLSNCRFF